MTLAEAATARTLEDFVSRMLAALGARELYIISHDLTSLHSLGSASLADIHDEDLLDSLVGGRSAQFAGSTFVPLLSGRFPLLVAAGVAESAIPDDTATLLAPLTDLYRDLFDGLEYRRRQRTFKPAAQLQWSLLPMRAAVVGDLEVAGILQPAASVAGDAYDLAVTSQGLLTVLVMDAMGHGVTATLSTSLALATMRTVRRGGGSLEEQVRAADAAILAEYDGDRFITMVAVEFNGDKLSVVNAGHEPVRKLSAHSEVSTLDLPADPPLGLDGLSEYRVHSLPGLKINEALVLLSDGAAEARSQQGAFFGEDGVNQALRSLRAPAALQTASRIGRAITTFVSGDLGDDLTAVVVQRNEP